MESYQYPVKER